MLMDTALINSAAVMLCVCLNDYKTGFRFKQYKGADETASIFTSIHLNIGIKDWFHNVQKVFTDLRFTKSNLLKTRTRCLLDLWLQVCNST